MQRQEGHSLYRGAHDVFHTLPRHIGCELFSRRSTLPFHTQCAESNYLCDLLSASLLVDSTQ